MIYEFDAYVLDIDRRELRRAGQLIAIEPQVFDLLAYLLGHRDRVVTKDEILDSVWHGRIVSESTLTSRINSARAAIGDNGKVQRLIKTLRHKGLRFVGAVHEPRGGERTRDPGTGGPGGSQLPLPDKPSIAVLPFVNLSGDTTNDYFADGMVEDISIALGRLPWLFVIASASAFTFKGRMVDVREIGTDLGVRYVLQGSVRKDGNRVRIAAQLTDALNGQQVWRERLDGDLQEVFALQDEIAAQLSARIAPTLRSKEIERARRLPTSNLTAYDLFLQAMPPRRDDRAQNKESLRHLYEAIELDPTYGTAYGLAAWCYEIQTVFGWLACSDPGVKEGIRLANLAVEYGQNDPEALWMAGTSLAVLAGETERACDLIEKSLSINPNSARAWWASGIILTYRGSQTAALDHFARSRRLNPLDTAGYGYWTAIGMAHFFAGDLKAAHTAVEKALTDWKDAPHALRLKAAVCGLLGRIEEGRSCVKQLLGLNPGTTLEEVEPFYHLGTNANQSAVEAFLKGLRICGLRERAHPQRGKPAHLH
jgi:TolB-like protein